MFSAGCTSSSDTSHDPAASPSPRTTKIDSIESLRYLNQGKTLIEQHEYLDAYAAFTTAIETFDRNGEAYRCRAWVDYHFLHPGQEAAGEEDWEKAHRLQPDLTPTHLTEWEP